MSQANAYFKTLILGNAFSSEIHKVNPNTNRKQNIQITMTHTPGLVINGRPGCRATHIHSKGAFFNQEQVIFSVTSPGMGTDLKEKL